MEGGTADLLAILDNTTEFSYIDICLPVTIYYGLKDDRISLASVKALQSTIPGSDLYMIDGADHSLLTNSSSIVKVFDAIKADWAT